MIHPAPIQTRIPNPLESNQADTKYRASQFFEKFWTVTDLAEHLKVSPKTIYDWVHRRVIPFHKVRGTLLRFKPSEIEKWLSEEGGQNGDK